MASINIEYTEHDLKKLVMADLAEKMPDVAFKETDVKIETKSNQNYRAEWEQAAFRATIHKTT